MLLAVIGGQKAQQPSGIVVPTGLVAYYPCNEGSGDTIIDQTGIIGNMTFTGPVSWGASWLTLPGTSAASTTKTYSTSTNQALTYCASIRVASANAATFLVFEARVSGQGFTFPMLFVGSDNKADIDDGDYISPSSIANVWTHITISKPSGTSTATYYINGTLSAGTTSYAVQARAAGFFRRGAAFYFNGDVRRIRIYNVAINSTEATAIYNADIL